MDKEEDLKHNQEVIMKQAALSPRTANRGNIKGKKQQGSEIQQLPGVVTRRAASKGSDK